MPKVGTSISASRLRQIPAASPVQGDVFVSSQNGTDGGAGTFDDPVDSLDEVASLSSGDLVRLERGSDFQSSLVLGKTDDVAVQPYGTRGLPLIDCSEEIPDSGWSLASGQSNTYEQSLSAASTAVFSTRIWEEGAELTKQSSISDVEANAGSYYVDTSGDPWIYYLHPTASTDPSSDGKLYETNRQEYALENASFGGGEVATTVQGVRAIRPLHNDGSIVVDAVSEIKECILEEGGKHHMVHGGGTVRDSFFVDAAPGRATTSHSSIQFFHGSGTPDPQPAKTRRSIFIDTPKGVDTRNHTGFNPADHKHLVAWECEVGASMRKDAAVVDGGYLKGVKSPYLADGLTIRHQMIDSLATSNGNSLINKSGTIEDSVVTDACLKRSTEGTGETLTVKRSVLVTTSSVLATDINSNNPTLDLTGCIVLNIGNKLSAGFTLTGDNCIFVSNREDIEVNVKGEEALSSLQSDTGAFGNSVFCTLSQWRNLLQGDWRKGDVRVNGSADVTQADGTVLTGQLPDGTPITDLGPQSHADFATETYPSGPPSQWPTPPITKSEREGTVEDLGAWDWQGAPVDHRIDVSLGDRLLAGWDFDGVAGENEPDQINGYTLTEAGDLQSASVSGLYGPARELSGEYKASKGFNGSTDRAIEEPKSLWVILPVYTTGDGGIFQVGNWRVTRQSGPEIRFKYEAGFKGFVKPVSNAALQDSTWHLVQVWQNHREAKTGVRVDDTEVIEESIYNTKFFNDKNGFKLGLGGGAQDAQIARSYVANVAPQKADRDWMYNGGSYRTLSEIQNRTVTVKEI